MEVRLLGERDEASYLALRSRSIEEHAELATPEILRELYAARAGTGGLLVAYGQERKSVVGAFYGGSLVGAIGLDADRGNRNPEDIRLWGLYVVPHLRGSLISQLLLEEAIAWSRRQRGKMTVSVQFSRNNQHAFRFFNRNYFSMKAADTGLDAQASTPGVVFMDYFLGE